MIFYLNRGLILEQEVVRALQGYLNAVGAAEYYGRVTVHVTNRHPFGALLLNAARGEAPNMSVFPAIVVATEADNKPGQLENLVETGGFALTPEDVNPEEEGGKSPLEEQGYLALPSTKAEALREAVNEKGKVYGRTKTIRRQDLMSIQVWAENVQIKNELYELVRLFVCGFMPDMLAERNPELVIFDSTVRGERSNNFNIDFGVELHGGHITFEADYAIEQSIIDTEAVDANEIAMEVINHVKGQDGTARSVVFDGIYGGGDTGGDGGGSDA